MSLVSLIARALKAKQPKPVRTPAPRSLWQGTAIDVSPVGPILLKSAGGRTPDIETQQTVVSVGRMEMFGHAVFRSYLADGKSFVQTVADPHDTSKATETRLYTIENEVIPADESEWDFLLSDDDGYVGYPFFDIGDVDDGGVRYPRLWTPGQTRIAPVEVEEIVTFADGTTATVSHRLMQYGRSLGEGSGATSEYLLADVVQTEDGASFDVLLGFDLGANDATIIPSAI